MSDKKVLCPKCRGVDDTKPNGSIPKLTVDPSKLDRSKILPLEEYEVNQAVIANKRLREIKCPACGHEYMKPLSVIDWSQFGLVITYQCTECYLTMTISEQCNRLLKQFNPGLRFDYTGSEIEELAISHKEHSRLANSVLLLMKKLEENNIELDRTQFPPYRWNNEKPVVTGFTIPEEDLLMHKLSGVIQSIKDGYTDHAIALIENLLKEE
jgi:hypothetical protein